MNDHFNHNTDLSIGAVAKTAFARYQQRPHDRTIYF